MSTVTQTYDPAVPIDSLIPDPENARIGDEETILESMTELGFYGAVLVQQSTRKIIAGNHRTKVALAAGETTVPVLFLDVDDDEAERIGIVDNRSNDKAKWHEQRLTTILGRLEQSGRGLVGTGFDKGDLSKLLASMAPPTAPDEFPSVNPDDLTTDYCCPSCNYEWSGNPKPGTPVHEPAGGDDE